jgi:hypothetical protein
VAAGFKRHDPADCAVGEPATNPVLELLEYGQSCWMHDPLDGRDAYRGARNLDEEIRAIHTVPEPSASSIEACVSCARWGSLRGSRPAAAHDEFSRQLELCGISRRAIKQQAFQLARQPDCFARLAVVLESRSAITAAG